MDVHHLFYRKKDPFHLTGSSGLGGTAAVDKHPLRRVQLFKDAGEILLHQLIHHLVITPCHFFHKPCCRHALFFQLDLQPCFQFPVTRQPQMLGKPYQHGCRHAAVPGKFRDRTPRALSVVSGQIMADIFFIFIHAVIMTVQKLFHPHLPRPPHSVLCTPDI